MGQRRRRAGREGGRRLLSDEPQRCIDLSEAEQYCTEPSPLERVRRAYADLGPGERLEVRSPVAEHAFTVRMWSRRNGVELLTDERRDGVNVLVLRRPA